MKITKTLYVTNRKQWRSWLARNHASADEIWLVYYKKNSGKPRIPYNDAVDEALCYGWIDSTVKALGRDRNAQRFSPRRKNSRLSEMNKERIRRLIKAGKMTPVGLERIKHHLKVNKGDGKSDSGIKDFIMPADILEVLKADKEVWNNFKRFPEHYKRIRIGWIDTARRRPEEFKKRLRYFMKMTKINKTFGMIQ
jgi:uncharacterized protein YdeI (YjbR/CyaY-like superfamily)